MAVGRGVREGVSMALLVACLAQLPAAAGEWACHETYWLPTAAANGTSLSREQSVELFRRRCPERCQTVVSLPSLVCGAACVGSQEDCVKANPSMSRVEGHVCKRCNIPGCQDCGEEAHGDVVCRRCFGGFVGEDGHEGAWKRCSLWDEQAIRSVAVGVAATLVLLLAFLFCSTSRLPALNVKKVNKKTIIQLTPGGGRRSLDPLLADCKGNKEELRAARNRLAIIQGLYFSVMSSLKWSSIRQQDVHLSSRLLQKKPRTLKDVLLACNAGTMADLRLGLTLFFNSQVFLILVALILWLSAKFSASQPSGLFKLLAVDDFSACAELGQESVGAQFQALRHYAEGRVVACLGLWALLALTSLAFYALQRRDILRYFRSHLTAAAYAVRLDNVPPSVTSERTLKAMLEEELQVPGKIHGVSIAYDLKTLPDAERIRDMIERVVEHDDLKNDWCSKELATPMDELEAALGEDQKELEELLSSGKLQGSGTAFVVFKEQRDALRTLETRCGLSWDWSKGAGFRRTLETVYHQSWDWADELVGKATYSDAEDDHIVHLSAVRSEPTGIQWYDFGKPEKAKKLNLILWMPLRMLALIGIYALASESFYAHMIQPYNDALMEGAESDLAVMLTAKSMVLLNIAIQTIVMVDVGRASIKFSSRVDMVTFLWNTFLQVVTMGYFIAQEAYREGVSWVLRLDADDSLTTFFQSTRMELLMGRNLVNLMISEILYMYVMGELANVLLPLVVYRPILRIVFYWRLGSDRIRGFLQSLLPRSKSSETLTSREAEQAQTLMPLMLWMEYTYIVVFPAMAFMTFYLANDSAELVFRWLLIFAVVFYIWQRYIMLWAYGKTTYDSSDSFVAFIKVWGLILGMLPTASVWWSWRLGLIPDHLLLLMMALVFALVSMLYSWSVQGIDWLTTPQKRRQSLAQFMAAGFEEGDPGYSKVMDLCSYSWWNVNPVYVLKMRHCPHLKGHECLDDVECWPVKHVRRGFFELGKEFRHLPMSAWKSELLALTRNKTGIWSPRKRAGSQFSMQKAGSFYFQKAMSFVRRQQKQEQEEREDGQEDEEEEEEDEGEAEDARLEEARERAASVRAPRRSEDGRARAASSGDALLLPGVRALHPRPTLRRPGGEDDREARPVRHVNFGDERATASSPSRPQLQRSATSPSPASQRQAASPSRAVQQRRTVGLVAQSPGRPSLMDRMAWLESATVGSPKAGGLAHRIPAVESALGLAVQAGSISERIAQLEALVGGEASGSGSPLRPERQASSPEAQEGPPTRPPEAEPRAAAAPEPGAPGAPPPPPRGG